MASKQRGITLLSFVLVLIVLAIFAVLIMNLFPVYREAFSVESAMKSVAQQPNAQNMSVGELQRMLQKRFDIDYVDNVSAKQLTLVRDRAGNQLQMTYEVRKPLVYNLDFVAMFDYTVPIEGGASTSSGD
jgi:type II secretory pathway component PulJ